MKRLSRLRRSLAAALLAATCATCALAATDSFYLSLLDSGIRAQVEGDHSAAARDLRIAAFGLLDEPARLTVALVRLGISQSALRDGDGFRETFARLMEIEERFGSLSSAAFPADLRAAFEEAVPRHIPEELLAELPLFEALADKRAELRIAGLPPRQRQQELETRLRQDPDNPSRLVALARLHVEEGRYRKARPHLDRACAIAPDFAAARCLRGTVAFETGDCQTAVGDLARCQLASRDPELAAGLLKCQVRLRLWPDAVRFLAGLTPAVRTAPTVASLAARVERELPSDAPSSGALGSDAPIESAEAAAPAEEPATMDRPAADLAEIESIRQRAAGSDAETLRTEFAAARRLADAPGAPLEARLLAGELAYRLAEWQLAKGYLADGGELLDQRPLLQFYLAVSLYESGDPAAAATRLQSALPHLARTALVDAYAARILGPSESR